MNNLRIFLSLFTTVNLVLPVGHAQLINRGFEEWDIVSDSTFDIPSGWNLYGDIEEYDFCLPNSMKRVEALTEGEYAIKLESLCGLIDFSSTPVVLQKMKPEFPIREVSFDYLYHATYPYNASVRVLYCNQLLGEGDLLVIDTLTHKKFKFEGCSTDSLLIYFFGSDSFLQPDFPITLILDNFQIVYDTTSSAVDLKIANAKLTPNPTSNELSIRGKLDSGSELMIYDRLGRLYLAQEAFDGMKIDVSSWPSGMYAYKVVKRSNGEKIEGKLVIIK